MSEQTDNFWAFCQDAQSRCLCVSTDSKECATRRDDLDEEDPMVGYRRCQCSCHEEIAEEMESQEWPL